MSHYNSIKVIKRKMVLILAINGSINIHNEKGWWAAIFFWWLYKHRCLHPTEMLSNCHFFTLIRFCKFIDFFFQFALNWNDFRFISNLQTKITSLMFQYFSYCYNVKATWIELKNFYLVKLYLISILHYIIDLW